MTEIIKIVKFLNSKVEKSSLMGNMPLINMCEYLRKSGMKNEGRSGVKKNI